jgi:hypothetical protein
MAPVSGLWHQEEGEFEALDLCKLFQGRETRSHGKTGFSVTQNGENDLKHSKAQDFSLRSA